MLAGHELEKYRAVHDLNKWLILKLKSDIVAVRHVEKRRAVHVDMADM